MVCQTSLYPEGNMMREAYHICTARIESFAALDVLLARR